MKAKSIVYIIYLALVTLPLVSLTGCSDNQGSVPNSNQSYSGSSTNSSSSKGNSESSTVKLEDNSSEDTASNIPKGEPTFLIGPDGKAILTSEITRLENTDKTAETLTEDDLWADVYCDGFAYCKEPCGVGYDSYNNPELFDGYDFLGEVPENKNEWKRVNVGDEICGLKVKSATAKFCVNDWEEYTFPARYFYDNENGIELEGTIEVEGFLQVNNRSVQYPDTSELMWFYPTYVNLPLSPSVNFADEENGFETRFDVHSLYSFVGGIRCAGEFDEIHLGYYRDAGCDMDGLSVGDTAYARVTLGNIKCYGNGAEATLENVELLSDIIDHRNDDTEKHQPAPVL